MGKDGDADKGKDSTACQIWATIPDINQFFLLCVTSFLVMRHSSSVTIVGSYIARQHSMAHRSRFAGGGIVRVVSPSRRTSIPQCPAVAVPLGVRPATGQELLSNLSMGQVKDRHAFDVRIRNPLVRLESWPHLLLLVEKMNVCDV